MSSLDMVFSKGTAEEDLTINIMDTTRNVVIEKVVEKGSEVFYVDFESGKKLYLVKVQDVYIPVLKGEINVKSN